MPVSVQIVFHEINHSDALELYIRQKIEKLESFFPSLMSCHVRVEQPHRHQSQGRQFSVRILLHVPGAELAVNQDQHADAYMAVWDAFAAAHRQLKDHSRQQRGDSTDHDPHRAADSAD